MTVDSENDLVYPNSTITLGPEWQAFDDYPGNYEVFINGSAYMTGSWQNGVPLQVPVTNTNPLIEGRYNITVVFTDGVGNQASTQRWVRIISPDISDPFVTGSNLQLPENFFKSHLIEWTCNEENLLNISLYLNENGSNNQLTGFTIVEETPNSNFYTIIYELNSGTLSQGLWNYTLLVRDMGNNIVHYSILVSITSPDTSAPVIVTSPTKAASQGYNELFSFTAIDTYPLDFTLQTSSNTMLQEGNWSSGVLETLAIDNLDLPIGPTDLELILTDLSNNVFILEWNFILYDIDNPVVEVTPTDFSVYEHEIDQPKAPTGK